MVPQANILSVLPAKAPVEVAPPKPSSAGDDSFRSHMEDAVKHASSEREKSTSRAEERAQSNPAPKSTQDTRTDNRPVQEHESPKEAAPPAAPVQTKQTETAETVDRIPAQTTNNREAITDQLKALGVPQNNIDELLNLLNLRGTADLKTFLQSLAQTSSPGGNMDLTAFLKSLEQTLNQQAALTSPALDARTLPKTQPAENPVALSQSSPETLSEDILLQAGLTQKQAKELLAKVPSAPVHKDASQLNRETQLNAKTEAEQKLDQKLSLEKLLNPSAEGASTLNEKSPVLKPAAGIGKPSENQIDPSLLASQASSAFKASSNAVKGAQTLSDQPDVQVTQVQNGNTSSTKILESQKALTSQTYNARGTEDAKVIQQILHKISLRSHGNQNEIKVRLEPPSLGTVRMNVSTSGDAVKTVIMTDNNTVKQIIESNLAQLRDSLNGNGLKVESFTVLVGGESGSGSRQNTPHEQAFASIPAYAPEDGLSQEPDFAGFPSARERIHYDASASISVMA